VSVAVTTRRAGQHRKVASTRTPLRVVRRHRRKMNPTFVAAAIVISGLFTAVVGHALLAEGQVRLGKLQTQATAIQATNRSTVLKVSSLETPERIAQAAGTLHLVQPSDVIQLPSVPLNVPLPAIKIYGMTP